jgi:AcrR family transcriptional regulator
VSKAATSDPRPPSDLGELIVDAALSIAEEKGRWSAVRLHDVADRLSIPATQVLDYYRDLDAVADAWFGAGSLGYTRLQGSGGPIER